MTGPAPGAAVVRTEHLSKSYGLARGIVDVTVEVGRGEVFGFLGPNGAGKTTTIRTLMGFIRPSGGSASIFGLDVSTDGVRIRRRTGFLSGDVALYERMTGHQLFEFLGGLRGGVRAPFLGSLVDRLDLDPSRRIEDLSHGNRQKVGLVQAFMHRPELVVLDEPTQGLDPLVQREFHRILDETRRDGRTVFMSSHVLSEVERTCDRVAIIREGRVVAVEQVHELTARALRHVEIVFAGDAPADELRSVPGVQDLVVNGPVVRCTLVGGMDPLVKAIARHEVRDLVSDKPSLEEIFLTFYGTPDAP